MVREIPDENFHERREAAIKSVADFALGWRDNSHSGVRWIRHQFVRNFGGDLRIPESDATWRLRYDSERRPIGVRITVDVSSVADARPILDVLFGTLPNDWRRDQIERHLEAATGRRNSQKRSPAHLIVRALAMHYLTRNGGGRLAFKAAWTLYQDWFGDRDSTSADGWDQGRQREILEVLEREFGPLAEAA